MQVQLSLNGTLAQCGASLRWNHEALDSPARAEMSAPKANAASAAMQQCKSAPRIAALSSLHLRCILCAWWCSRVELCKKVKHGATLHTDNCTADCKAAMCDIIVHRSRHPPLSRILEKKFEAVGLSLVQPRSTITPNRSCAERVEYLAHCGCMHLAQLAPAETWRAPRTGLLCIVHLAHVIKMLGSIGKRALAHSFSSKLGEPMLLVWVTILGGSMPSLM
jgi:hypothetical protein